MKLHHRVMAPRAALRRFLPLACTLAMVLAVCWAATDWARALYILTGEDDTAIVLDGKADVSDFSSKLIYIGSTVSGFELTLTEGQNVTVFYEGASLSAVSKQETISALLSRLHVVPGPLEMVAVDLSGTGVTLSVASDLSFYERVTEAAPFQTVRVVDPSLSEGTEEIVQAGADGVSTNVYEVVYSGGELASRQLVRQEASTAVDQIVHVGTSAATGDPILSIDKNADGSGTLHLKSGATLNFSGTRDVTATAYTTGYDGVGSRTATGTQVHVGSVAVDKRVIPLGSRLYIVTDDGFVYGMAVAEDTGVRGNAVDLYMDSYRECISFGRRSATVYLLD